MIEEGAVNFHYLFMLFEFMGFDFSLFYSDF
jgi:hypothetical protein